MLRVLVVDDDAMVRRLVGTILGARDIEVVAEAADGDEAVPAVQAHHPDVVLMDLRMLRMDGVEATAAVRALPGAPGVLVLTSFDTDDMVLRAIRAGAAGLLPKDASPDEIVAAVRAVADGGAALSPRAAKYVVGLVAADDAGRVQREAAAALEQLTERELEVARLLAAGLTNAEIARQTYCSEATVKTHLGRATTKLGLENRVQLAVLVERAGLV